MKTIKTLFLPNKTQRLPKNGISFYLRKQIDFAAWDACVEVSEERNIYAFSWYLDCITQKNWGAFICVENGQYIAIMPLPLKQKFGIYYIAQPFWVQQLGIYSITGNAKIAMNRFISNQLLYAFSYVNYSFNIKNEIDFPKFSSDLACQKRITCLLPLNEPHETLKARYSYEKRRSLRILTDLIISESTDIQTVINIFRENKGTEISDLHEQHYKILANLFIEAHRLQKVMLLVAHDTDGQIMAGGLFLIDQPFITFLFSASSAEAKRHSAMAKIIDTAVQKFANQGLTLDFEGSMIPGVAQFYQSFGAKPHVYSSCHYNRWQKITDLLRRFRR